jgi:hypothetical protein
VLGWDYQHVYPLGPDRWLWLFQDAFIDHSGLATSLDGVGFAHNAALVQTGTCFTLLHPRRGGPAVVVRTGAGEVVLSRWWWPLGGELDGGVLRVFWAEMVHDGRGAARGDGLPWHPGPDLAGHLRRTDLTRTELRAPAAGPGAVGSEAAAALRYAVASDDSFTYLFGNTYQQNLTPRGRLLGRDRTQPPTCGSPACPRSLDERREVLDGHGLGAGPTRPKPIDSKYWTENPMQPASSTGGGWRSRRRTASGGGRGRRRARPTRGARGRRARR